MTHPLTDKMCLELSGFPLDEIAEDWAEWQREDMRAAADWQLDKVLEWLNENLSNYTDDTYLGDCNPKSRPRSSDGSCFTPTRLLKNAIIWKTV